MSCSCAGDLANIYSAIGNLEGQFNYITGNTMTNYNQLSRIVSQQSNIYNTIYYGLGNIATGNLIINNSYLINGNLSLPTGNLIVSSGNILSTIGNIVMNNGNIGLINGNLILSNGNIGITAGNLILSNGNIGITTGNLILSNGNIGIKRTNPKYELDINGSANITGNVNVNSTNYLSALAFLGASNMTTPFKMVYGSVSSGSVLGDATLAVPVTFPNAFSSAPWVVLVAGSNSSLYCTSTSYTSTGFTANGRNISTSSTVTSTINYLAIGPA